MDAQGIELRKVEILNQEGPALHFFNAQQVALDGFRYNGDLEIAVRSQGSRNNAVTVSDMQPPLTPGKSVEVE